jgi:hypothetical protein
MHDQQFVVHPPGFWQSLVHLFARAMIITVAAIVPSPRSRLSCPCVSQRHFQLPPGLSSAD